ncbi:MAG: 3-ketoacyl-ACP reductase [Clostridiales bacterium]|nr:3-ketoacyl-ACP reductase [Clostridiales bacterium]
MSKIAIVTGGGRGIGFGVSKALAKAGFIVCLMGSSDEERYFDALTELRSFGNDVFYFKGSIDNGSDRKAFTDAVVQKYKRIDLLVNNAGVAPKVRLDILETTEESFDHVIGINLKGTMFLTQLCANQMISQNEADGKKGTIINISSFSSTVSSPNRAEYCISKAGISMLTKLYADRLAPENIFVYEIQPGIIRTDMTSKVTEKYDRLLMGSEFPIHRWGTPEDIANAVMVFAEGKITYTTGQVLHIDGGYMNVRSI